MPILTNRTDQPITASTGHTVPAHGTLTVSADTLERIGGEPYIAVQLRKGALTVAADPDPEPEPFTRSTIAKMRKADLVDLLEGHGVTADEMADKTADDLREMAARVIFLDL